MDSNGETEAIGLVEWMDPSDRRRLEGVGIPRGTLLWIAAERSSKVAAGVVNGRRCAW